MGKEVEEVVVKTEGTPTAKEIPPPEKKEPEFKPATGLQPAKTEAKETKDKKEVPVVQTKTTTTKSAKLDSDDDEIPEDAELLELSPIALKRRIDRATKAELRARFGTDKPDEIKAKLDKLAQLEEQEETRKREAMSEKERLENDLKRERTLREDAERRVRMATDERVISKEDDRMTKILGKHLDIDDEDDREVIFKKLARHLKAEYSEEELLKLKDGDIEKWAKKFAADNPKRAREVTPVVKKEPVTNGADTRDGGGGSSKPSGQGNAARNFSPSGPDAMSAVQARQEAAKQGLRW